MSIKSKRRAVAVTVAALTVALGAGGAIAATGGGPPGDRGGPVAGAAGYVGLSADQLREQLRSGSTLAQIAVAQGKTVDGLKQALLDDAKKHLASAVADGKLTADQAAAMLEHLTEHVDEIVERSGPPAGGRHGQQGMPAFEAVLDYLGLTADELRAELRAGSSLAQVATAQGKTRAGLEQAMLDGAKERLDRGVADGKLTAAQAATMLEHLTEHVDEIVERAGPPGPGGRHGPGPRP